MNPKFIAILTSKESWFIPYAKKLEGQFNDLGYQAKLFTNDRQVGKKYQIVFILSYFKILESVFLKKHKHNLVVHESDLPRGKGWAPLFWQVLEGKNRIPIVLFEANSNIDEGNIYLKSEIQLAGNEIHDEIREKQALKTIELCLMYLKKYDVLEPKEQKGKSSFYRKRTAKDSELDINNSIKIQFNLLRISNNKESPAFFRYKGRKYIIKIFAEPINNDINKDYIQIRRVTPDDIKDIFRLSSEPDIRQNSFHQKKISFDEHRVWFAQKIKDRNCLFFVATSGKKVIGQLRFDLAADHTANSNISVTKLYRRVGVGKQLFMFGIEHLRKNSHIKLIKAAIKEDNYASRDFFEATGFKYSGKDMINGQECFIYVYKIS